MSTEESFIDFLHQNEEDSDEGPLEDPDDLDLPKESVNIPLSGSPLYPRIYTGDSAKPLASGPFPETEIVDDNITNTWHGLMSFYG
jgi:hypothetical protein